MTHPLRGTFVGNSIVRLADEGVPLAALSRCFKVPFDSVSGIVKQAIESGIVVEMPQADWPAGTRRAERSPTAAPLRLDDRPDFLMACKQVFGLTLSQGKLVQCLMQAPACTKPHLHAMVAPAAEPKIVDVFVCLLRPKLGKYQIRIETIWGQGYSMPAASKAALLERIGWRTETIDDARRAG